MLDTFAKEIDERVFEQGLVLPIQRELVLFLEERKMSGGYNWCYYFVDHETRTLFWIQECDPISDLDISEITALKAPYDISAYTRVPQSNSCLRLLGHEIEAKYWYVFGAAHFQPF